MKATRKIDVCGHAVFSIRPFRCIVAYDEQAQKRPEEHHSFFLTHEARVFLFLEKKNESRKIPVLPSHPS